MKSINSLDHLITALDLRRNDESYLNVLCRVKLDCNEFYKYFSWNDNEHTRNSLYKNDNYDLVLKCYEMDQKTPIQEYKSKGVWVMPILGELNEELFQHNQDQSKLELVSSSAIRSNEYSYMYTDLGIHRFSNKYEGRTASLNIRMNSSNKCRIYNEQNGSFTSRKMTYNSVFI